MALLFSPAAFFLLFLLLDSSFASASASGSCKPVQACLAALKRGEKCPTIPLPESSRPTTVRPGSFALSRLRPGVWSFFDGTTRTLLLYHRGRLVLVDFPSAVEPLTKATLQILKGTVPYRVDMVYSHRHFDHIGGAGGYYAFLNSNFPRSRIVVWGTEEAKEFISRGSPPPIPLPNVIVGQRGRVIKLSRNLKVNLIIFGGHTMHDLASYVVPSLGKPGIVHFVDVVIPGFTPGFSFALSIDLERFIKVHKKLLALNFSKFSGGHGRIGNRKDVMLNLEYTLDALQFAKVAESKLTPAQIEAAGIPRVADPNAPEFGNFIFGVITTLNLESEICLRKLIAKYGCILGAVDVVGRTHCLRARIFNIIDNPTLV